MSNSNWKDLPDWTSPEDYAFLANAEPREWAWEFLRRNPAYRDDWEQRTVYKSAHVYEPPKQDGESDHAWASRVVHTLGNPNMTRQDLYLAAQWGLRELYDPSHPFSQGVSFLPSQPFPRMIHQPDDFYRLMAEEEIETGCVEHVANEYAVIAFDLTQPVGGQGERIEVMLREWKAKMLEAGRITKAPGHAAKPGVWKRHLRALDALRIQPAPKHWQIAKELGGNGKDNAELAKEGGKFIAAARKVTEGDYKKILLFKNTPSKKTPNP